MAAAEPLEPAGTPSPPPAYETTVTALRLSRPLADVPSTVTVMPREEIDRTPALAVDDLVRAIPSAGTFRRTPSLTADPTSQGLNLRGIGPSGVSRALVLVDGLPANDPFGGWVYWRALPRLSIDRIEVAPGGTSALYGNFAMGGVVQMISRPIADRVEADAAYGSRNTLTGGASVAGRMGTLGGALEAEGLSSDGYVPVRASQRGAIDEAADSRHAAVNARVAAALGGSKRLGASGRLFDERGNGGTRFTTARVRTADFGLTFDAASDRAGKLSAWAFGGVARFEQSRARVAADRASEERAAAQEVPSTSQGAAVLWSSPNWHAAGTHTMMAGADVRRIDGHAEEMVHPAPAMTTAMSVVGRKSGGEQHFAGLFAQELYEPLSWLAVSLAGRVDLWKTLDGEGTVRRNDGSSKTTPFPDRNAAELSPRLGLLFRPTARTRVRATAYRAFRIPTLNELYRPFQVGTILTAANEDLDSEHLIGATWG